MQIYTAGDVRDAIFRDADRSGIDDSIRNALPPGPCVVLSGTREEIREFVKAFGSECAESAARSGEEVEVTADLCHEHGITLCLECNPEPDEDSDRLFSDRAFFAM